MSQDRDRRRSPAVAAAPTISAPPMPCSSGASALFNSATDVIREDTDYVEAWTAFQNARVAQCNATRDLVLSRMAIAKTMADLAALPELCAIARQSG